MKKYAYLRVVVEIYNFYINTVYFSIASNYFVRVCMFVFLNLKIRNAHYYIVGQVYLRGCSKVKKLKLNENFYKNQYRFCH